MDRQALLLIKSALQLAEKSKSQFLLLFCSTASDCRWVKNRGLPKEKIVLVVPQSLLLDESEYIAAGLRIIRCWSGNQSRFSRIKYTFLQGVVQGVISEDSKVVCVLGPWGTSHLDTLTIHDLSLSWSEEFPFDPRSLIHNDFFNIVMAVVDIALEIGASGREGKPVGTSFVVADTQRVLRLSHQAVFNPFKGYLRQERLITIPEVVESIKELAQLDGAFLISEEGFVVAAGRHLDTTSGSTTLPRGLGARHRAAAGITAQTDAVAVVVSGTSGRVTVFENGKTIATFEPVIGRRVV
ncbi:MAG: diadenylate cyclase [Deltaproteobacteria bacterium]